MPKPSVLIVTKERRLAQKLAAALSSEFSVEILALLEATRSARRHPTHAAFIVDLGAVPDEALRFIKRMRAAKNEGVIVALSSGRHRELPTRCYERGADGYVAKSGAVVRELRALIRWLLHRTTGSLSKRHRSDDIALSSRRFWLGRGLIVPNAMSLQFPRRGRRFELNPKELGILDFFAHRKGKLVRRSDLVAHVWGPASEPDSKSLDTYLSRLRKLYRQGGAEFNAAVRTESKIGWCVRR